MQKAKRIAVEMLEKDNPVTFNANWLRVQDRGLYKHLRRKLKNQDSGEIEWDKFINQLPEKWMERWVTGMRAEKREQMSQDRMKFTFLSAIERLNLLLEENTPGSFSSTDVESYDEQLYSYFKRHVAKEGGGIDWEKIMSGVDEKYRKRCGWYKI